MTLEQLLDEGRKLERRCNLLKPTGAGEPVARWFECDKDDESITGHRRWMTLRSDAVPQDNPRGEFYFSLYTKGSRGGVLDFVDGWPLREGILLYAHPVQVLPPIHAVFARGATAVGEWLQANDWSRTEAYNSNFKDAALVDEYEKIWFDEHPIYRNDPSIFAATGGWHWPGPDSDWYNLMDAKLLVTTVRDSEPWVEAFQLADGSYKVIQRIT